MYCPQCNLYKKPNKYIFVKSEEFSLERESKGKKMSHIVYIAHLKKYRN